MQYFLRLLIEYLELYYAFHCIIFKMLRLLLTESKIFRTLLPTTYGW